MISPRLKDDSTRNLKHQLENVDLKLFGNIHRKENSELWPNKVVYYAFSPSVGMFIDISYLLILSTLNVLSTKRSMSDLIVYSSTDDFPFLYITFQFLSQTYFLSQTLHQVKYMPGRPSSPPKNHSLSSMSI